MGVEFDYKVDGLFSIEKILEIRQKVRELFEGFSDFSPEESQRGYFEPKGKLPVFDELEGLSLVMIHIDGYLPSKDETLDTFIEILKQGESIIGDEFHLAVCCGFEEKNSKQTKRAYDTIRVWIRLGKLYFDYGANGSKVNADASYAKDFIKRLIHIMNLPIRIEERDGQYFLAHTSEGELSISRSLWGRGNPTGFSCEVMGTSIEEIVGCVKQFFAECATKKRFDFYWSFGGVHLGTETVSAHERCKRIYDMAIKANFPADHYFIDIEFTLQDLEGIEVLKSFCGPKDDVYTRLCSFDLPEDNYGEIKIVTTSKGHQLRLTLRTPDNLKLVEKKLGLKFSEA